MIKNIRLTYRVHPHDNGVLNGGTWHWHEHGVSDYDFFECNLTQPDNIRSYTINDILGHVGYLLGRREDYHKYRFVASRAHRMIKHERQYQDYKEILTVVRVTQGTEDEDYLEQPVMAIMIWADAVLISRRVKQTNAGWEIKFANNSAQSTEDFMQMLKHADELPLELVS